MSTSRARPDSVTASVTAMQLNDEPSNATLRRPTAAVKQSRMHKSYMFALQAHRFMPILIVYIKNYVATCPEGAVRVDLLTYR